jgi:hypothetical protein
MVMVKRGSWDANHNGWVYEGRILHARPGKLIDWYIEGIDAGGNKNYPLSGSDTTSCAQIRQIVATGPVFYAGKNGSDSNPGTYTRPFLTIGAALTALSTSTNSGRNGGVFVFPGEYHERLDLNLGTDGYQRFLEGFPGKRDTTILCGANEMVENGFVSNGTVPISWAATTSDSIYVTYMPGQSTASSPGDSMQLVVLGFGEQLHRKSGLKAMYSDSTLAANGTNSGEASGWFWQNDSLYVKRRNGQKPTGLQLHVGYRNNLIHVTHRNWRIANLTLRYAGGVSQDTTRNPALMTNRDNPGEAGNAINTGAAREGSASGLVVDSCSVYGCNKYGVDVLVGFGGSPRADTCVVANSVFDGLTVGGMSYGAGKARSEETDNQIELDGNFCIAFNDTVRNTFNGIGGQGSPTDTLGSCGDEIAQNFIFNVTDDALEFDDGANINNLFYRNETRNTGRAFSICPAALASTGAPGPEFVFYNLFTRYQTVGVKGAGYNTALLLFEQNTVTSPGATTIAVDLSAGGFYHKGSTFLNNILGGSGGANSMMQGSQASSDTAGLYTNHFNYNLMDSTAAALAEIASVPLEVRKTLTGLRALSEPWETNGHQGAGQCFTDSSRFDYTLPVTSPAHGRARRITGVNTGLDGNRYGTTPDHGARPRLVAP